MSIMTSIEYNARIGRDEAICRLNIKRQLREKNINYDCMETTESLEHKLLGTTEVLL
jgi:hypothetical protein